MQGGLRGRFFEGIHFGGNLSVVSLTPRPTASPMSRLLLARQSDEDLISLLRAHDAGAFEELVERYRAELLRVCRRMVGSREDAEDVLQEVFTSAYFAIVADERPIICRPWLHRIAKNRCLNWLRQRPAIEPLAGEAGRRDYLARAGTAETAQLNAEMRNIFGDLLDLPRPQREALVRYELGGESYEEIARAMGSSLPSVRSLLLRARSNLVEVSQARIVSCIEIRTELAGRDAGAPLRGVTRRHLKLCESCARFGKKPRWALHALPFGPGAVASFGSTSGTAALGPAAGGVTVGVGGLVAKAAAGLAVLALAGAGAVAIEHSHVTRAPDRSSSSGPSAPPVSRSQPVAPPLRIEPRPLRGWHATASTGPARRGKAVDGGPQMAQPQHPAVSETSITPAASQLLNRRTRPLPGSGSTTERTRPAAQLAPARPASGSGSASTSVASTGTSSSQSSTTTSGATTTTTSSTTSSTTTTAAAPSTPGSVSGTGGPASSSSGPAAPY